MKYWYALEMSVDKRGEDSDKRKHHPQATDRPALTEELKKFAKEAHAYLLKQGAYRSAPPQIQRDVLLQYIENELEEASTRAVEELIAS
ncbi:MAG: hypothetical protein KGL39_09280 [Patescibacteria group bacterium]|nr:hypothetical protein [Patescibacteria group bacterium]